MTSSTIRTISTESGAIRVEVTKNEDGTLTIKFGSSFTLSRLKLSDARLFAGDVLEHAG